MADPLAEHRPRLRLLTVGCGCTLDALCAEHDAQELAAEREALRPSFDRDEERPFVYWPATATSSPSGTQLKIATAPASCTWPNAVPLDCLGRVVRLEEARDRRRRCRPSGSPPRPPDCA